MIFWVFGSGISNKNISTHFDGGGEIMIMMGGRE
jgi:hypothetical protein